MFAGMISRLLLLSTLVATLAAPLDRRIVDRVTVGDAHSEFTHACARAERWMRCALTVFDDTEVSISATFAGDPAPRRFDVIVENTLVTTYTLNSPDSATVEFRVPLTVTSGHTNILVMLRAPSGLPPALLSLRSVQDHNE